MSPCSRIAPLRRSGSAFRSRRCPHEQRVPSRKKVHEQCLSRRMKESHRENQTHRSRAGLCAERNSNLVCVRAGENSQAFSPAELAERALYRRAVEAVIWGMPAVNAELMFQAMPAAKADFNQVVYWSRPNWKDQTLTPNPDGSGGQLSVRRWGA